MVSEMTRPAISVVTPVYQCRECIAELVARLQKTLSDLSVSYEIILVNDGSPDDPWPLIQELASKYDGVKGINFSRNFGQHYAISAGIDYATGDFVVVMDCDLQDPPEEIPLLYKKALEGYDLVLGNTPFRTAKSWHHRMFSWCFYRVYDYLSDNPWKTQNASFLIMSRRAAEAFRRVRDRRRQFVSVVQYLGFPVTYVELRHDERPEGKSSYTFMKRVRLGILGLTSSTTRLLRLGIRVGLAFSGLAFIIFCYVVYTRLAHPELPIGWASLMSAVFFVGGVNMMLLGVIGLYLETIFYEVKDRPLYIIQELANLNDKTTNGHVPEQMIA